MNKIEIKISHPPEWPTKTIYEACPIVSRGTAPVYVENSTVLAIGQRCVREFGFQPEEARFHDQCSMTRVLEACKGDVLLNSTGTGTIGRSCIFNADGTYIIDGHVTLLRSDPDQLDGRWLNALLQSSQGQLHLETQCYSGSTNQVELSRERLSATLIPLPFLPEQCRIAEILDTIDEAIQKTEALVSKLKAMKQGLLHDLLTSGLDKNGKLRDPKARPEQFKNSPLGRIPKEWKPVRLLDLVSIPNGQVDPKEKPYCRWTLIAPDHIESGTGRLLCLETAREQGAISGKYAFKSGDVLYSKIRPYLRKAVLADRQGLCSADMYPLQPSPSLESRFLLGVILGEHFSRFATSVSERSGFPKINRKELGEYWLALPTTDEQLHIASVIETHDARIHTEEQYGDKLKLQKKGLMHDLLTGKVRVRT